MTDFIKLGVPGDMRDYTFRSVSDYQAMVAQPFAAKVDTQSEFGALDAYSEWVVEDWQAGVGKRDPRGGGMLYAHMDTRFPNQMILPLGFDYPYRDKHPSSGINYTAGDHTITATPPRRAATAFVPAANQTFLQAWVYLDAADGTTVTLQLRSDNGLDEPSSTVLSSTDAVVSKSRPGPTWVYFTGLGTAVVAGTQYHIVLLADATMTIPKVDTATPSHVFRNSTWEVDYGFSWLTSYVAVENYLGLEDNAGHMLFEDGDHFLLNSAGGRLGWIVTTSSRIFAGYGSTVVELTGDTFTTITTTGSYQVTDMVAANGIVYIAYGPGYKTYTLSSGAVADVSSTPTYLFAVYGGFLWRSFENDLYQNDGSGWVQLDPVGPEGYEIRGMAGLGQQLYMSTDYGLYTVAPGDFIMPVTKWPTTDGRNGRGMVEWMGNLYIPLAEDLVRFGQDGSLTQVGLRAGEELPIDVQGSGYRLATTNYFLLASLEPSALEGSGTLWAYNGQGWHQIGLFPTHVAGGALLVDTFYGYLYWGGGGGLIGRARYPSNVVNPIRDRGTKQFARHGWIEQDRFYGNFRRLIKDWESVYLDTESMGSAGSLLPYWKADESEDWSLLTTVTTEDTESRWDDLATRPQSKWLRFGMLMRTDDEESTPILRAHSVKFHSMENDRWRWPLLIPISANQQQLDGQLNSYTVAQRKAHLEGLIQRTAPFLLEDVDGAQYWVKVISASRGLARVEYINGAKSIDYLYAMTVEQLTAGEYEA